MNGASLGEVLALTLAPVRIDWAEHNCARNLAGEVSDATGIAADRVFDALTRIPDNMLALLTSPEGWSALAQYVAADLGVQRLDYRPRVH